MTIRLAIVGLGKTTHVATFHGLTDCDRWPLIYVADAFMLGRRRAVDPSGEV